MEVKIEDLRFFQKKAELLLIPEWSVRSGETYLLSGPTGCGKSTFAKWLAGRATEYAEADFTAGKIGIDLYSDENSFLESFLNQLNPLYLLQDAYTIFNPYRSVGRHIRDVWSHQRKHSFFRNEEEIFDLLQQVGIEPSKVFLRRKAHQISQGEAQRVALILGLIRPSRFLILDEIFSNVDRRFSSQMMEMLTEWQKRTGMTIFFISHNIGFFAPHINGHFKIMEGRLKQVDHMGTDRPNRPLMVGSPDDERNLLYIKNLRVPAPGKQGDQRTLWSSEEFYCGERERVGISGISGIGKTTFLLGLMGERRLEWEEMYIHGKILKRNSPDQSLPLDIRYLLQSVVSAFNPVQTIKKSLREIQKVHKVSDSELEKLIFDFDLGMNLQDKYPGEVSGGEIQRFGVLSLLMGQPDIILFDESFSSVDSETRELIWELILQQQREKGFALITVSHDVEWLYTVMDRCVFLGDGA